MVQKMSDETAFTIRLPKSLAGVLRERATADHRSLNKEIVFLLEQVLNPPVVADAHAKSRGKLSSLPRYRVQPFTPPSRPSDDNR